MDDLDHPTLRSSTPESGETAARPGGSAAAPYGVNENAELVADLIGATSLLSPDRVAQVRGRALQTRGSFAQALADEGFASSEGLARLLATRHGLAYVELAAAGVDEAAVGEIALHVLERVTAIPYALRDGVLHVAVADPANVHALDELKLASRHSVELA